MRSRTLICCFLSPFDCSSATKLGSISLRALSLCSPADIVLPSASETVSKCLASAPNAVHTYQDVFPGQVASSTVSLRLGRVYPCSPAGRRPRFCRSKKFCSSSLAVRRWLAAAKKQKGCQHGEGTASGIVSSLYFAPERGLSVL